MSHLSPVMEQVRPTQTVAKTSPRTRKSTKPEYDWRKLDIEDVITEDDTPVDGILADKQHRFLVQILNNPHLPPPLGQEPFVACTNVGLFSMHLSQPLVPDVFLSLNVKLPHDIFAKRHRAYFIDIYGKPPEVVVEVVSNRKGGEDSKKLREYALIGVRYYVIYDPEKHLSKQVLRSYELQGRTYVPLSFPWLAQVNLGLTLWQGVYEGREGTWLRWCDYSRQILLTDAEQERLAKEQERLAKEQEQLAREQEHLAKERLAAKLRELGVDPETL